jgi:dTDP-3-amino-3,4,6-trideoxy-alpha-D-glucose transaminase
VKVPVLDLRAGNDELRDELDAAYARVMASGRFVLGAEVEAFEHEFAGYCGAAHCVGVGNGLDAITLIVRALGLGPGDEVIVPSHGCIATWLGVSHAGAVPVPVECDERTFNLDPARVDAALTSRTRAVLPVHLYGQPADMTALRALCARAKVALIEDVAQAHGARCNGQRVGALGIAAAFSFYPTKNLGALGDGGAVVTDDAALAERVRRLRNYGALGRSDHDLAGANSRLDEVQAAWLRVRLRHLDAWNARRAAAAARYGELLKNCDVLLPTVPAWAQPVWHLYVVRTRARDAVRRRLAEAGVETLVHYPVAAHLQRAFADLRLREGALPVAERLAQEVLSLPLWPQIAAAQQAHVAAALRASR